jgi:hypothetical protein
MSLNSYELSRNFWDFSFENPEKVSPNHSAIYFFAIEHCNRMGWKSKFGFPSQMAMEAIGIKKHHTYIKYFNDLCEWGFFILVEKSRNQYSANIISLNIAMPKNGEALGKARTKHAAKQTQSNGQSTGCIDKHITLEQKNNIHVHFAHLSITTDEHQKLVDEYGESEVTDIYRRIENYAQNKKYKSLYLTAMNWLKDSKPNPTNVVIGKTNQITQKYDDND